MSIDDATTETATTPKTRIAIFVLVLMASLVFAAKRRPAESQVASNATELERWLTEVDNSFAQVGCRYPDESQRLAQLEEMTSQIELWQSRAQVAPEEFLGSARRLETVLSCGERTDTMLAQSQERFMTQFRSLFRAHYALLRRAQKIDDGPGAVRAAKNLKELLHAHEGELSQTLSRFVRATESQL